MRLFLRHYFLLFFGLLRGKECLDVCLYLLCCYLHSSIHTFYHFVTIFCWSDNGHKGISMPHYKKEEQSFTYTVPHLSLCLWPVSVFVCFVCIHCRHWIAFTVFSFTISCFKFFYGMVISSVWDACVLLEKNISLRLASR